MGRIPGSVILRAKGCWGGVGVLGVGQDLRLHAVALESAQPLPRIPGIGIEQQLGRNAMRPVGLGRRNGIHVGSQEAGPVAAISSIVETCRRLGLAPPRLPRLCCPGLSRFSQQERVFNDGPEKP